jgi:hypothetical protein
MVGLLKLCDVHWSSSTSLPCSIALDTEVVEATRQEYVLFLRAPIYDGRPSVRRHEPDFRVETIKPKAFRPPKDWSNRSQMTTGIVLSILRRAAEPPRTIRRVC